MILSEQNDITTDIVCSWLNHFNCKFLRINEEEAHNLDMKIRINNGQFTVLYSSNDQEYDLSNIEICWYRRGFLYFHIEKWLPDVDNSTNESLSRFLENEGSTLKNFLYQFVGKYLSINHPDNYNCNKLIALYEATKVGFKIPNSLISRYAADLMSFIDENKNCISKSIQDIMPINYNSGKLTAGKIVRIDKDNIPSSNYWYSLFQKEIAKKYELRIFVFLEKIYAMAIFSQLDVESSLDYRDIDVNGKHPNRMVPYNLPDDISIKVKLLMRNLHLESGSIDIIVTPDNDYYFLEVNPVGQFNFVSVICNYHIEKDIAEYFSQWQTTN